jgi:hypothetical protein
MPIKYNETVMFGRSGAAKTMNCEGIDFSEDGFESWTAAPLAEMEIQLPLARQDVVLEIQAAPFVIREKLPAQNVFIYLGGFFIGYHVLAAPAIRQSAISRSFISGRPMRLALVIPTAVSPSSLGMGNDLRELGLRLRAMVFKVEQHSTFIAP